MARLSRLAALVLAVTAMVAVPLPAPTVTMTAAAPPPPPNHRVTYRYKTFLDPTADYWTIRGFDVVFGTLTLTFNPDKTIVGTYTPDFSKPQYVSGRLVGGGHLSLEIGSSHFSANFTPRGIAAISGVRGANVRLWAQFVRATSSH
jgi:hypothetical protein